MLHIPTKSRICNICGTSDKVSPFYKGVTSRCVECHKKKVRENRAEKVDYYRTYDAKRYKENPQRREAGAAYKKTPRGAEIHKTSVNKWRAQNQVKRRAHTKVGNALRAGILVKPDACTICGDKTRVIHGHHHDYSKPLDVLWVCPPCHRGLHT
jgi:hypothetical protein